MVTQGITQDSFITQLEVALDANYTEEQKELIRKFGDGPVFCFADPGTGKTYTAIGGLINAECFKGIPGSNIYALSFTRLATGELSVRHERACQKTHIAKRVTFATLHSLCRSILKENYQLLGMHSFDSTGELTTEKAFSLIQSTCDEWGVAIEPNQIRNVVIACKALNAALIFDKDIVVTKMKFKECNLDYETFDRIRGLLFSYSLLTEKISVSDLLLYTVMLLQKHPEVSAKFKEKCKLMLVDEAQDLSLLQLRIISLLTDNPILIGDMKQQIYGFNGACQEIVDEFHKLYPNATDLKLTQSFRCKNEIAQFATKIILPNKVGGEDYKGIGDGGIVMTHCGFGENGLNIKKLVDSIENEFLENKRRLVKDYLFLTRNNISVIPIIEELYKRKLPFRVNKFQKANEIPVIRELCEIIQLAANPANLKNIISFRYLLPEFRGYYNLLEHPLYIICSQTGASPLEVNYQFKEPGTAAAVMNMIMKIQNMLNENANVGDIFNTIWPLFEEQWLRTQSWRLENKPSYYTATVASLVHKPYQQFLNDEVQKAEIIKESEQYGRGVRCYTMHASKGLEADCVYVLDADNGIIPNAKKIKQMQDKSCDIDAARQIREERSLCYVACTRAKNELHIVYNEELAPIITGDNPYSMFDSIYDMYNSQKHIGDDIQAFKEFTDRWVTK